MKIPQRRKPDEKDPWWDCLEILKLLKKQRKAWPFKKPVDPKKLNIPDYYETIVLPMDLGTVEERLYNQNYNNMSDFANDIRLIWSNAETFNGPNNDVTIAARQLRELFEKSFLAKEKGWRDPIPCTKRRQSRPDIFKRVFKHCSIQSYPPEDSLDDMKPTVPELPENPTLENPPDILLENIIPSLGDQSSDIIPPSLHSSVSSVHLRNPIKSISGSEMKPEPEPGLENICSPELNENSTMLEQAQELLEMYPQSAARQALGSDPTQLPTGVNV